MNGQVIKDSIFGKPKFVKEYVLFINESGPFTFMQGDSAYGHSIIMKPENLRGSMKHSWFSTNFCRYINNETWYNSKRNLTKEVWFEKSGELMNNYLYKYDKFNRLINVIDSSKYSLTKTNFYYEGKNQNPFFKEYISKDEDEPEEYTFWNFKIPETILESKYDPDSRTDSIFLLSNNINRTYTRMEDSIFYRKLSRVKIITKIFKFLTINFLNLIEVQIKI